MKNTRRIFNDGLARSFDINLISIMITACLCAAVKIIINLVRWTEISNF